MNCTGVASRNCAQVGSDWIGLFLLSLAQTRSTDIQAANHFVSSWKRSPFRHRLMCALPVASGLLTVQGTDLVRLDRQLAEVERQPLNDALGFYDALRDSLRITVDPALAQRAWDTAVAALIKRITPWLERGGLHLLQGVPSDDLRLLYRHALATVCPSVAEGFDFAIRMARTLDPNLVARPLGVMREAIVASPAYLAAHAPGGLQEPLQLSALEALRNRNFRDEGRWLLQRGEDTVAVPVQGNLAINHFIGLRRAVVLGLGVARLPRYLLRDELERGGLVELLPDWQLPATPVSLVYPSREHLPERARVFRDFVLGWFQRSNVLLKLTCIHFVQVDSLQGHHSVVLFQTRV